MAELTKKIKKPKQIKFKTFVVFFIGIVLISTTNCQSREDTSSAKNKNDKELKLMKTIKQNLEQNIFPEKEKPFIKRDFDPYLNGEWIGDAVSYGCYREGQAPGEKGPSEAEILEDLKILSEYWNLIRIYGADGDSEKILKVIAENKLPFKVLLGVWLENETKAPKRKKENIEQVLKGIQLGNEYPEILAAINVGNESQVYWSAHRMEMNNLIKYLRYVRNNTSVPVTTADDYNFWNKPESKTVADEIDFIVTHIYPLWNGKTLDNSIDWLNNVYFNDVKKKHSDKVLVLGEIGWATNYNKEKIGPGEQGSLVKAEVSYKAQEKFLLKLNKWVNTNKVTTFLFEAFDEPWKGGGENTGPNEIEKNWGVFYENRKPKESFKNFLINRKENNGGHEE